MAIFAMREDYLATLDPYLDLVPTRFSNTFRLDLLKQPAAVQAIRVPAAERGVDFAEDAAQELARNLSENSSAIRRRPAGRREARHLRGTGAIISGLPEVVGRLQR